MTTHSQGTGAHSAHQRSHRRNDRQIGWKPADGVQLAPSKHPQPVLILQRARLANGDPCQPHLHDVSIAKGPGSGRGTEHLCAQRDLDPQLLTDLTQERVLRALPRLDLPPWQLPPAGQLRGLGPAATEQGGWPGQIVDDRRADNGSWGLAVGVHDRRDSVPGVLGQQRTRGPNNDPGPQGRPIRDFSTSQREVVRVEP